MLFLLFCSVWSIANGMNHWFDNSNDDQWSSSLPSEQHPLPDHQPDGWTGQSSSSHTDLLPIQSGPNSGHQNETPEYTEHSDFAPLQPSAGYDYDRSSYAAFLPEALQYGATFGENPEYTEHSNFAPLHPSAGYDYDRSSYAAFPPEALPYGATFGESTHNMHPSHTMASSSHYLFPQDKQEIKFTTPKGSSHYLFPQDKQEIEFSTPKDLSGLHSSQPTTDEFMQDPPGPVSMYPSQHMGSSSSWNYARNVFMPFQQQDEVRKAVEERNQLREGSHLFGEIANDTIFQLEYIPTDAELNDFKQKKNLAKLIETLPLSDSDLKLLIVFKKYAKNCPSKPRVNTPEKSSLFNKVCEAMLKKNSSIVIPQREMAKIFKVGDSTISRIVNEMKHEKSIQKKTTIVGKNPNIP